MSAHAFYAAERLRWPGLHNTNVTNKWAEIAVKKLARHFFGNGARVLLTFGRKGTNWSWGGMGGITLADQRDWLVLCHEFAHVLEFRRHGSTVHRKRLARIVDTVCRYVERMGWAEQDLEEQFSDFCASQQAEEAPEAFAVTGAVVPVQHYDPGPIKWDTSKVSVFFHGREVKSFEVHDYRDARALKIEKKKAHVVRLERRIKGLSTRVKKLKRSIAALARARWRLLPSSTPAP